MYECELCDFVADKPSKVNKHMDEKHPKCGR